MIYMTIEANEGERDGEFKGSRNPFG
jgi:hypothetical protein